MERRIERKDAKKKKRVLSKQKDFDKEVKQILDYYADHLDPHDRLERHTYERENHDDRADKRAK